MFLCLVAKCNRIWKTTDVFVWQRKCIIICLCVGVGTSGCKPGEDTSGTSQERNGAIVIKTFICTYSATHQVPLLLEQRIGEDAVRHRVAVLQARRGRHASQVALQAREQRRLLAVVALAPDALVLLLHPVNLKQRDPTPNAKCVKIDDRHTTSTHRFVGR